MNQAPWNIIRDWWLNLFQTVFIYIDGLFNYFGIILQTVLNLQPPLEYTKEVNDYKSLIRTLVMGTYCLLYSIHAMQSF